MSDFPDVSSILPAPFEWCEIAAGKVTIEYNETTHRTFDVPQFWMAKYPITNAQYQVFVDAQDGYRDPAWWGFSDKAKRWRREHQQPLETGLDGDELPRTKVTWLEAVAYCQWLNERLGQRVAELQAALSGQSFIMLPSEQQWQRAAQGDDGRAYPWGNAFEQGRSNTKESAIGKVTPVTQFPNGASPYGVMDMSGNVWEWCLSDQYRRRENVFKEISRRVVRGGLYYHSHEEACTTNRGDVEGNNQYDGVGFRVASRLHMPVFWHTQRIF